MRHLYTATDKVPTNEEICRLFSQLNNTHGVYLDYDRLLEYRCYYQKEHDDWIGKLRKELGYNETDSIAIKDLAVDFLRRTGLDYYAEKTKGRNLSVSAESLEKVYNSGMASESHKKVLKVISYTKSCAATISLIPGILALGEIVYDKISWEGHRMFRVYPKWVSQNTGRFAMQEPALQNLTRTIQNIITVPEGFRLLHVDSGQIDPRITFSSKIRDDQIVYLIRDVYGDAYYGLLHYATQDEADYRSKSLNLKKNEITEQMKKGRTALKTLGNAVLYGQKSGDMNDPVIRGYYERVGNHPERVKWQSRVENQIASGNYVFHTAFGTAVDVSQGASGIIKYSGSSEEAKVGYYTRAGINSEIQGTAADLMKFACVEENQLLQRNWCDSYLSLSVHDALYTAVAEHEVKDLYPELSKMAEYHVDDWIPILAEAEWGIACGNKIFSEARY